MLTYTVCPAGETDQSPLLGQFCGRTGNGAPLLSTVNVLTVHFSSDSSVPRPGFTADFKTSAHTEGLHSFTNIVEHD